ncbi:MAG TPA: protein translocase SEC61 complex subunit gamma [Candidatus Bathyarchaeota archaeon]|nr:protein translocase SEC61 complex subunit gamma [Candidatus Bathyarchaeota archaeon]
MGGLGLRDFLASCARLLRRARKPSREEVWLLIKICALGVIIVGVIGFVIRLIMFPLLGGG